MITVLQDRALAIPDNEKNIGFVGDNKTEIIEFIITDQALFSLDFKLDIQCGGAKGIVDLTKTVEADKITLEWEVKEEHIPSKGLLFAQLRAFDNTDLKWHSETGYFTVGGSINATEQFQSPLPSEFDQMEQRVTDAKNETVAAKDVVVEKASEVDTNTKSVSENTAVVVQKASEVAENTTTTEENKTASQTSANTAAQALSDLLAMLDTDIARLIGGKIPINQIPATAIVDILEITNETELTGLNAQKGDLAEIMAIVDGERTVIKAYQLLGDGNPTVLSNWVVWGTSYAVQAGNATTANEALNAITINNHRQIRMTQSEYNTAHDSGTLDPDADYWVAG